MINTARVLAAAERTVTAADCSLLRQHGGSLVLTKTWTKSLLSRKGFVKCILKPKTANWPMGVLDSLSQKSEIVTSVFKMASILDALENDVQYRYI